MKPIISFHNFTFQYHTRTVPALSDITLDIYHGEKILIVGAQNSGKTTLAHCISGLLSLQSDGVASGTLCIDGKDATQLSMLERAQSIGTVLQDVSLQQVGLTVGEEIAFAMETDCVPQPEMRATTKRAATLFALETQLEESLHTLSAGYAQRTALASALVEEIKVLLLDMPIAHLDGAMARQTMALMDEIRKESGTTVIVLESKIEQALLRDVDRILVLDKGSIVADMTPDALLSTTLLYEHGLQEPLYLTALRYAGVEITQEKKPQHFQAMQISMSDKIKVSKWFHEHTTRVSYREKGCFAKIEHLCAGYGDRQVLHDVSFDLHKGEILGVTGSNGTGKSTLGKVLAGEIIPTQGGLYLQNKAKEKCVVSLAPQMPILSQQTVSAYIAVAMQNTGMSETEIASAVKKICVQCQLESVCDLPLDTLSASERKRVALARALAYVPDVLVLDEPLCNQDMAQQQWLSGLLKMLCKKGMSVILLTQDAYLLAKHANKVLLLQDGTVQAIKPVQEFLCDDVLMKQASLQPLSLLALAKACYIEPPQALCDCFLQVQRKAGAF